MDRRDFLTGGVSALTAALCDRQAQAQGASIRFVYPYAPGSGGDTLIRILANDVGEKLGVSALVDNRTGADGRIGVRDVKVAEPDGRTLLFTPFGTMVLFPLVYEKLAYDPFKDFEPVSQLVTYDFGLAAGPMTPAKSLSELADWLKKNPDKASFGMPGSGALPHFLPLKFASLIGVDLRAIAYKGSVPALTDAMAGQIPLVCAPLADLIAQHQAGTIRILGVSGNVRSLFVPDAPTFVEQGYDVVGAGWYGVFAPARSPRDMIDRINGILVASIRSEIGTARARQLWLTPTGTTPAELGAIQKADFERWAPVVKASGFRGDQTP